ARVDPVCRRLSRSALDTYFAMQSLVASTPGGVVTIGNSPMEPVLFLESKGGGDDESDLEPSRIAHRTPAGLRNPSRTGPATLRLAHQPVLPERSAGKLRQTCADAEPGVDQHRGGYPA